jgi:phosphatidylserine/phosphatidylglycerophosphate/cardiolipin synthase-like enzyme
MTAKLKVYLNEDDALLFWSIPAPIAGCRGFAIERKRTGPDGKTTQAFLENRIGFENEKEPAKAEEGQEAVHHPSTEWPFQRFSWTDHEVNTGDTVSYQVTPVIRDAVGKLTPATAHASTWSEPRQLGAKGQGRFLPFFNRGFVMSQFMARYLKETGKTLAQFKQTIGDEEDRTIRTFLSGDLRLAMLKLLDEADKDGGGVRAALFELGDQQLVDALCKLGVRAQVVLANGSVSPDKGETAADARANKDENAAARKQLHQAHVKVVDRMTSPGPLAHNKFLVRVDAKGKPVMAWTGSTNWTPTGLCTQLNNGLLIEDADVAQIYLDQWNMLADCGSEFPPKLMDSNSQARPMGTDQPGHVRSVVWFTRTRKGVDMDALNEEVEKAREGILFLMFMPGGSGLFSTVAKRSAEPNLYVRGVVSELPRGRGNESEVDVNLVDGDDHTPLHLDIIEPQGVPHPFAHFAAEVSRKQFLGGIGHAIIHSKVVVIDPFSADPVVITGSHNFSSSASAKNDENFIIVRGDHALAEAYAVNVLSAYEHYRWRAFLQKNDKPFNGLKDSDAWQAAKLAAERRDLRFWGV